MQRRLPPPQFWGEISTIQFLCETVVFYRKGVFVLTFNFLEFSKIASVVYNIGNIYSLDECLKVFRCYFGMYEKFIGHAHPPIKAGQIERIIRIMPYIDREPSKEVVEAIKQIDPQMEPAPDIEPDLYPLIIQLHFKTKYRNCDYNINHFFSGRIRDYRMMEANKGYE